jgi:hypothetical protein
VRPALNVVMQNDGGLCGCNPATHTHTRTRTRTRTRTHTHTHTHRGGTVKPLIVVLFLGRICKITKRDYRLSHVCLFVRMEQLGSHWKDIHGE